MKGGWMAVGFPASGGWDTRTEAGNPLLHRHDPQLLEFFALRV
jgi:hypothetical protein